jgi:hypothetical protein
MLNRRTFLATVGLASLGLPRLLRASVRTGSIPDGEPMVVCAIGGLRRTSAAELTFFSAALNDDEREKIVRQVATEKPALLLLLGDQVSDGADPVEWRYYDNLMQPIRDAGTPMLAVRGTHEYNLIDRKLADQESQKRWPETSACPHFRTVGSIAYIGIDTNFDMLTPSEAADQQKIFVKTLEKLDSDPAVQGIIVLAHQAPYTNSALGPNQDMITGYAEPFLAAKKTRLFLSGQVHSYERFTFNDGEKQFINSGGGGAPRRTVDISEDRPFRNDPTGRLPMLRPFNFLKLTITDEAIKGESMMLQKRGFVVGDRFGVALGGIRSKE